MTDDTKPEQGFDPRGIDPLGVFGTPAEVLEHVAALTKESDRGCLLVGLADVDIQLGKLLMRYLSAHGRDTDAKWLLDPRSGNRPLGSLAMRTRFAYCLGLIDDEIRNVLDGLRNMRNEHAHGRGVFELVDSQIDPVFAKFSDSLKAKILPLYARFYEQAGITSARAKLITCFSFVSGAINLQIAASEFRKVGIEILHQTASENEGNKPGL